MAAWLSRQAIVPDRVLVSSALRTQESWALAAPAFARPPLMITEPRIYESRAETLLAILHEQPHEAETLMLVGHNPGMATLALGLADPKASDPNALAHVGEKFPTAGIAILTFDDPDWHVLPQTGTLVRFVTPGQVGGTDED